MGILVLVGGCLLIGTILGSCMYGCRVYRRRRNALTRNGNGTTMSDDNDNDYNTATVASRSLPRFFGSGTTSGNNNVQQVQVSPEADQPQVSTVVTFQNVESEEGGSSASGNNGVKKGF